MQWQTSRENLNLLLHVSKLLNRKVTMGVEQRLELTIRVPETIPAPPIPATALPTIRATELGAVAHTIDPASNMSSAVRKTHFTGNSA